MVMLTIKIWVQIWMSRTFLVFIYLSICNFPYFLTDKQKTKKVREIQILIVSITISYIFCALDDFKVLSWCGNLERRLRQLEVLYPPYVCPRAFLKHTSFSDDTHTHDKILIHVVNSDFSPTLITDCMLSFQAINDFCSLSNKTAECTSFMFDFYDFCYDLHHIIQRHSHTFHQVYNDTMKTHHLFVFCSSFALQKKLWNFFGKKTAGVSYKPNFFSSHLNK